MATRIPTQPGDVLILVTEDSSFSTNAVGPVSEPGQQDFQHRMNVKYLTDRLAAVVVAQTLVAPGGRIFLLNVDTNDWSELSKLRQISGGLAVGSAR
jgi:hypothetical protein